MPYDPNDPEAGTQLRACIRDGAVSFDGIVAELKANAFIDDHHDALSAMTRPGFNGFDSDEFDALFEFFYPGTEHAMKVLALGVPMHVRGEIVYALFDGKRINSDELI